MGSTSVVGLLIGKSLKTEVVYIEGILIHTAEPPLNRQGGRLKGVTRYLQVRDERLGPRESILLRELHQEVAANHHAK